MGREAGPGSGPQPHEPAARAPGLLVGPWQYQCRVAGWVYRVLPLPHPPSLHHPGTPLLHRTSRQQGYTTVAGTLGTCTYDRFETVLGDPRGGIRTGTGQGTHWLCLALPATLRQCSPAPPCAPTRPNSQYFSVFLSIPQLYVPRILSISQLYLSYISVILG